MAKVKVTQVISKNGSTKRQKANLEALGIRHLNDSVEIELTPVTEGMIQKVLHLVKVEEINEFGGNKMKLNNLTPAKGANGREKRIGRGEGSGHGGTSTRGHKGAQARSGYSRKIGFEGGQMPIQRRLPKFGFKNPNRVEYKAVSLSMLQSVSERYGVDVIDIDIMKQAGLASKTELIKVLGNGELTAKLEVVANAFSKSAIEKIEALGGKAQII